MTGTFLIALAVMLIFPFLGFVLVSRWINSLENLTAVVKAKTAEMIHKESGTEEENEMVTLQSNFESLYSELQAKMAQLNQYSQQLIESNVKLSEQAVKDELTTLYNRRYFDLRLADEANRAERYDKQMALIMMDIDGFKQYNDSYGHPAGDKLLKGMAQLIKKSVRKTDIPCRYGGDEFAVILPESSLEAAETVARKITDEVTRRASGPRVTGAARNISLSCGVAAFSNDLKKIVKEADERLYQAKAGGKGRVISKLAPSQA